MSSSCAGLPECVKGDGTGLTLPVDTAALMTAGPEFLTEAMRAFGALEPDNAVAAIVKVVPCALGSTGEKCFLTVAYARPDPRLHDELFVKFSRDFSDAGRDARGKLEMAGEVRFARYAAMQPLPVPVPKTYFADYDGASHTGLLITETIAFGAGGIEVQHQKCMDHLIDDPVEHYRAILEALAKLAAFSSREGAGPPPGEIFPYDPEALIASTGLAITVDERQLQDKLADLSGFMEECAHLLPATVQPNLVEAVLAREALRFLERQDEFVRYLVRPGPQIALCHWNANIDNCWFWRDGDDVLNCGLMDWGNAGQINLAFALWGSMSGAPAAIWTDHLPGLLDHFAASHAAGGGPAIDREALFLSLHLYVTFMGLSYFLDTPARIRTRTPRIREAHGPLDPLVTGDASTRNQLHMLGNVLTIWQRFGLGAFADLNTGASV
ncbi:hypothetical protein WBP07_23520 [Novosphingobium sp. BL-8A]|uniref:hypothetical protein n=1 Tax=Novosphingobium sp. BL-8A TaxID=3127639 RepID=UPI003756FD1E